MRDHVRTREEFEKGYTGFTGCGHNANLIWSSTKYEESDDTGSKDGQHITTCGSSATPYKNRIELEDDNTIHEVELATLDFVASFAELMQNCGCYVF